MESDDLFGNGHSLVSHREVLNGEQYLFRFGNGYGASVIRHDLSIGREKNLWELMVIKWWCRDYHLRPRSPIGDSPVGNLPPYDVETYLERIKKI